MNKVPSFTPTDMAQPECPAGRPNQQGQVRPSTCTTSPSKRSNYTSHIPVRVANPTCNQTPLVQDSHALPAEFPMKVYREVGPPQTREDPIKSLEKAFNIHWERLRADMRDFRGLCTQIIAHEKQESAKWYALCAKVIMERDYARQKINILIYERNNQISKPDSSSRLLEQVQGTNTPASRAFKRVHSSVSDDDSKDARHLSRSNSVEARPTKPLRHSPPHSPATSSNRLSPSPSPTTTLVSQTSSPLTPSFSSSVVAPEANYASTDQRPVKRRKSCDSTSQAPYENTLVDPIKFEASSRSPASATSPKIKQQPRTPSPLPHRIEPQVSASKLTTDFLPVDLMYVSSQDSFVCRACLLEKSRTTPPLNFEPKVFPSTVSWDALRDHCVTSHPDACTDVARLRPAEIFELRKRLNF